MDAKADGRRPLFLQSLFEKVGPLAKAPAIKVCDLYDLAQLDCPKAETGSSRSCSPP